MKISERFAQGKFEPKVVKRSPGESLMSGLRGAMLSFAAGAFSCSTSVVSVPERRFEFVPACSVPYGDAVGTLGDAATQRLLMLDGHAGPSEPAVDCTGKEIPWMETKVDVAEFSVEDNWRVLWLRHPAPNGKARGTLGLVGVRSGQNVVYATGDLVAEYSASISLLRGERDVFLLVREGLCAKEGACEVTVRILLVSAGALDEVFRYAARRWERVASLDGVVDASLSVTEELDEGRICLRERLSLTQHSPEKSRTVEQKRYLLRKNQGLAPASEGLWSRVFGQR